MTEYTVMKYKNGEGKEIVVDDWQKKIIKRLLEANGYKIWSKQ